MRIPGPYPKRYNVLLNFKRSLSLMEGNIIRSFHFDDKPFPFSLNPKLLMFRPLSPALQVYSLPIEPRSPRPLSLSLWGNVLFLLYKEGKLVAALLGGGGRGRNARWALSRSLWTA